MKKIRKTTEQFIEKSRSVHGDKYDYSKTVYKGYNEKVTIICPKHGEFQKKPRKHNGNSGQGCQKCSREGQGILVGKINSFTKDKFIERARSIHGDKFDYSKVVYKNSYTKSDNRLS